MFLALLEVEMKRACKMCGKRKTCIQSLGFNMGEFLLLPLVRIKDMYVLSEVGLSQFSGRRKVHLFLVPH
jgi:hypothetical protein